METALPSFDPASWVARADAIGMEPTLVDGYRERPGSWERTMGLSMMIPDPEFHEEHDALIAEYRGENWNRDRSDALCDYLKAIGRVIYAPTPEGQP